MKRIVFFVVLFVLLTLGVWILYEDAGYLLIVLKQWTVEMPLWLAVSGLIVFYVAFRVSSAILRRLFHMSQWLRQCKQRWHKESVASNTRRGLIEFVEGNWKQAEHYLTKALPEGDISLLNYLAAARAAQELGSPERRDDYLREAQKKIPDAKMAISLTQAQLQMTNEQWEQALATLNHLHSVSPHHPYVLKLLVKVALLLKDWSYLATLLPKIQHNNIMDEKDFVRLETEISIELLKNAAKNSDVEVLKTAWKGFSKSIHRQPAIVAVYIAKLLEHQAHDEAESACRDALSRQWDNGLIRLYGQCQATDIENQLRFAERYLKDSADNAYLLLALGHICMRRELWGKAKGYLTKSVQLHPEIETYAALATLSEYLREPEAAHQYYQKGLTLALQQQHPAVLQNTAWLTVLDNVYCLNSKIF